MKLRHLSLVVALVAGCATTYDMSANADDLQKQEAALGLEGAGYVGLSALILGDLATGDTSLVLALRNEKTKEITRIKAASDLFNAKLRTDGGLSPVMVAVAPGSYRVVASEIFVPGSLLRSRGGSKYQDVSTKLNIEKSMVPFAVAANQFIHLANVKIGVDQVGPGQVQSTTRLLMSQPSAADWQPFLDKLAKTETYYLSEHTKKPVKFPISAAAETH